MFSNMRRTSTLVALVLAITSVSSAADQISPAADQEPQPPPAAAPKPAVLPNSLKIIVLEGQGGTNVIQGSRAVLAVVEVRDMNDRLVSGADVTFRVPVTGPSGFFQGGQLSFKTQTTSQGQAGAAGFHPNSTTVRFR